MAVVLRPGVDLRDDRWTELMEKYNLGSVISVARMQALWRRIRNCCSPVIWYELQDRQTAVVAATLGAGIDRLLEEWSGRGHLLDAWAADCLAMEALQCLYQVFEDELKKEGLFIGRYIFADKKDEICQLLKLLSADIQLNSEGMMQPVKSVVYQAILTDDVKNGCGTVCRECRREDCPHRQSLHVKIYREPGVLKYSYGYQRIFEGK